MRVWSLIFEELAYVASMGRQACAIHCFNILMASSAYLGQKYRENDLAPLRLQVVLTYIDRL
jgi:hypothetical protein